MLLGGVVRTRESSAKSRVESEAAARYKGKYCDSEVDLTYELFAWYEPLLMMDLIMRMNLELYMKLL